jgi:hypothetical protein
MSDAIQIDKTHRKVRYSISIILPPFITFFVSRLTFDDNLKSLILSAIASLPFGIDWCIKNGYIKYNEYKKRKEIECYENDVKNILDDCSLAPKIRENYESELDNVRMIKLKTHKNNITKIDNTLSNLE